MSEPRIRLGKQLDIFTEQSLQHLLDIGYDGILVKYLVGGLACG